MTQEAATALERLPGGIGFFEKWLSVWVALCIVAGLALGSAWPGLFAALAGWNTPRSTCPSPC
jgi:ACR3 family arsenite transporter